MDIKNDLDLKKRMERLKLYQKLNFKGIFNMFIEKKAGDILSGIGAKFGENSKTKESLIRRFLLILSDIQDDLFVDGNKHEAMISKGKNPSPLALLGIRSTTIYVNDKGNVVFKKLDMPRSNIDEYDLEKDVIKTTEVAHEEEFVTRRVDGEIVSTSQINFMSRVELNKVLLKLHEGGLTMGEALEKAKNGQQVLLEQIVTLKDKYGYLKKALEGEVAHSDEVSKKFVDMMKRFGNAGQKLFDENLGKEGNKGENKYREFFTVMTDIYGEELAKMCARYISDKNFNNIGVAEKEEKNKFTIEEAIDAVYATGVVPNDASLIDIRIKDELLEIARFVNGIPVKDAVDMALNTGKGLPNKNCFESDEAFEDALDEVKFFRGISISEGIEEAKETGVAPDWDDFRTDEEAQIAYNEIALL
ncbi:MAG: hypothetical protein A2Y24_05680 [Clostridiales bacterium GWE2_32_10]|nr:MAG: hypothetical protein A2Y24_05680 [Clostridiales bacterium GWE2_32_10]HBY21463.1 hypothetical protein [Clostridiales bacterium]